MRNGPILALLSLAAIFAYAVYRRGGVYPADWNWCLLALAVLAVSFALLAGSSAATPALERSVAWPLLLLPFYSALQLLPLPQAVLRVISPARAYLVDSVAGILPGIKWAPLSVVPAVTLEHLFKLLAYLTVFLLVRELTWRSSSRVWIVVFPILGVTAFEAVLGLTQAFSGEAEAMAKGTYVNRNHFAGLIGIALPFAVMYPVAVLRKHFRQLRAIPLLRAALGFVAAAVLLLAIVYSFSRMGFLANLASVLVITIIALGAQSSAPVKWLGTGIAILFIIFLFAFLSPDQMIQRFASLSSGEGISAEGRLALWRETGTLIRAYPLFGCGIGGYEAALHKYKLSHALFRSDYAHNDYLQLLAELGAFGFTITIALALAILLKLLRTYMNSKNTDKRCVALACIGSFTAIGLHSLVDFNLYIPANAMLLAWVGGIAAGMYSGEGPHRRKISSPAEPEGQLYEEKPSRRRRVKTLDPTGCSAPITANAGSVRRTT
jgi:O-antigen ligase